jgi:hypothetical protein
MTWRATCLLILLIGCCGSECSAQCVRLDVDGEQPGKATAFCIGETNDGQGVYLTAKHNLRGAERIRIKVHGDWYTGRQINQHPSADVASFEAPVLVEPMTVGESEPQGESVRIPGFGPEYFGRTPSSFTGVLETGYVSGERGLHPIPGDSGAPVVIGENTVVGVVKGYETPFGQAKYQSGFLKIDDDILITSYRSDHAEQRLKTVYTGVVEIRECLQQCYQSCPSGGCRIYLRNEYRQPIGFLGLPAGPPQRVQVAEPVPRVFVPEDQPQRPVPDRISVQGPPGPQGPPGRDGRSVTQAEVESIINAWLDANRDQLRGPAGPQGPPGAAGGSASTAALETRLTSLEQRPFRIILSSDGKVIDDETYRPGEPVVLDLKRLRSVSDAN